MVTVGGAVVVVVPAIVVDVVPVRVVVVVDVGGPGEITFAAPIAATPPTSTTAPPHAMNRLTGDRHGAARAWSVALPRLRLTNALPDVDREEVLRARVEESVGDLIRIGYVERRSDAPRLA